MLTPKNLSYLYIFSTSCCTIMYTHSVLESSIYCNAKNLIHLYKWSSFSPSSSRPASVSRWHAHNRAVVFHTLHRGHRDTIICPLMSSRLLIFTRYSSSVPRVLLYFPSFTLLLHPLTPLPLPMHSPLPGQALPVTTTTSVIAPPVPFLTPTTGLTVMA